MPINYSSVADLKGFLGFFAFVQPFEEFMFGGDAAARCLHSGAAPLV